MHKIHEKEFTLEDFSTEHLISAEQQSDEDRVTYVPPMFTFRHIIVQLNFYRERYLETKDKKIFNSYTPHIQGVIIDNLPYIEEMYNLANVDTPIIRTTVTSTLNITITGKLSTNRKEFVDALKAKGITEVAIAKADVLICNEPSTSSKYKYATAHKITIMTANEFETKYGI
jgi:hypothetical protein